MFDSDIANPLFFAGLFAITVFVWIKPYISQKYYNYYERSLRINDVWYPPKEIFPLVWIILDILTVAAITIYWWSEGSLLTSDLTIMRWYIVIMFSFFFIVILKYLWSYLFWSVPVLVQRNKKSNAKIILWSTFVIIILLDIVNIFTLCALIYRITINHNFIIIFTIIVIFMLTLWVLFATYLNFIVCYYYNYKPL